MKFIEYSVLARTDKELNDVEIVETLDKIVEVLENNDYEAISLGYNKDYTEE